MAWLITSLRRLRHERLAVAGLAGLVFVTSVAVGAAPRMFERVAAGSLQEAVAQVPPAARNVELASVDRGQPGTARFDDIQAVEAASTSLRSSFPAPLPAMLGRATSVVETPSYQALEGTALAAEVRLRIMQDVVRHVRVVAGRQPTGAVGSVPNPLRSAPAPGQPPSTIPQLEAAISAPAAGKLGLAVGSRVVLAPAPALDPLADGAPLAVRIVGIVAPDDATDSYWIDDARILGWTLREFSSNVAFVQATLLVSPDAYGTLLGLTGSRRITWRYPADPGRVAPAQLDATIAALRRLQGIYPSLAGSGTGATLQTGLLARLVALQGPWSAAGAVLTVAGVGVAAVAVATLGLVVVLISDQRRRAALLQHERGESSAQALTALVVEGTLIAAPPTVLGALVAMVLVPGRNDGLLVAGSAMVAGLTVVLQLLAGLPTIVGSPGTPGRRAAIARATSPRRLVLEGLVVGIAALGAVTLRDRGLAGPAPSAISGAAGVVEPTSVVNGGAADPFLFAVPVLVGVSAGLLAIRLAPYPLRMLVRLAARRRGLVAALAMRRAARGPEAARALLVLLAIGTVGAFASATLVHLDRSADLQAWQDVGAAYRIDAGPDAAGGTVALPGGLDAARLPGAAAAAEAYVGPVSITTGGQRELVAIDAAAYQAVVAGTPAAVTLPAAMLAGPGTPAARAGPARPASPPGEGVARSTAAPLPAIISAAAAGPYALRVGDMFQVTVGSATLDLLAVEARDGFPGVPAAQPFVIVSRQQAERAAPGLFPAATTAFLREASGGGPALAAALRSVAPPAVLVVQADEAAALRGRPVVGVVSAGLVALAALALVYGAIAVVILFLLAASSRAIEVAQLQALGLSDGDARVMLMVEFGPPVAIAVLAGLGLGLGLFAFLEQGLGLGAIIGAVQSAPPGIDPLQVTTLIAASGVILAVGVVLGARAQRLAAATAVRSGPA